MRITEKEEKNESTVMSGRASSFQALEFLAFRLGEEEYGIDIQKVQELRGYDNVTRIANAPERLGGVSTSANRSNRPRLLDEQCRIGLIEKMAA